MGARVDGVLVECRINQAQFDSGQGRTAQVDAIFAISGGLYVVQRTRIARYTYPQARGNTTVPRDLIESIARGSKGPDNGWPIALHDYFKVGDGVVS